MKRYFGFDPYEGDGKYGFVSYKSEEYISIGKYAEALNQKDINLWYDYGIPAGKDWDKIISEHIVGASFIVLFVTEKVFKSSVIMREIQTAEEWDIPVIPVFIENIEHNCVSPEKATFFTQLKYKQGIDRAWMMSEAQVADSLYELVRDIMESDSEHDIEQRKERLDDENSSQSGVLTDADSLLKAALAEVRAEKNLETEIEKKTEPVKVNIVISDDKSTANAQRISEKIKNHSKIIKRIALIVTPILIIITAGLVWLFCQPVYNYSVNNDGTATITPNNSNYIVIKAVRETVKKVVIPEEIDGHKVTSIGEKTFVCCRSLKLITIPNSVTCIGDSAFGSCESLMSITIPNSVTCIGDFAFGSCESLMSITIPNSVTSIGCGAFYDCRSLQSVIIPDSVTEIGGLAFYDCESLKSVTIPPNVIYIGERAFGYYLDYSDGNIDEYARCANFTIYGKSGSYAETYAKENNIPFVAE